jgi:hypothetical protein
MHRRPAAVQNVQSCVDGDVGDGDVLMVTAR